MADKPVPKPKSLREKIADRRRRLDAAIDGPPPAKPKKKVNPADGTNDTINRREQENL